MKDRGETLLKGRIVCIGDTAAILYIHTTHNSMIRRILLTFVMLPILLNGQQTTFSKEYSVSVVGAQATRGDFISTLDGGYLIVDETNDAMSSTYKICNLVKTDYLGVVQWSKAYAGSQGGAGWLMDVHAVQSPDYSYTFSYTNSNNFASPPPNAHLCHTDTNGEVIWTRAFGNVSTETEIMYLVALQDWSFLVAGSYMDINTFESGCFMARVDFFGNLLWSKRFESVPGIRITDGTMDGAGNIYLAGHGGTGSGAIAVIKTDQSGNLLMNTSYFTSSYRLQVRGIEVLNNSDIVITGCRDDASLSYSTKNLFLLRADAGGQLLWSKYYTTWDLTEGFSVVEHGNEIVVMGNFLGVGGVNTFLAHFDAAGQPIVAEQFAQHYGNFLHSTPDGGCAVSGFSANVGNYIWLAKMDSSYRWTCNATAFTYTPTVLPLSTIPAGIELPGPQMYTRLFTAYSVPLTVTSALPCETIGPPPPPPPPAETPPTAPVILESNVPNIFSPDGDQVNDVFQVSGLVGVENFQMEIFDRWGRSLFITNNPQDSWNGSSQGAPVSEGTYYYIVKVEEEIRTGFVMLMR